MNKEGKKIFLVDDEPMVLRALKRVLREEGHQLSSFENAQAALEAMDSGCPDCVISDYYMPKMDGLDFLAQVARERPNVFRVLLTGGYLDQRVHEAMKAGTVQVLMRKPWHADDIRRLMEAVEKGENGILEQVPIVPKAAPPAQPQSTVAVSQPAKDAPLVLVVDDDPQLCLLLRRWLEDMGYRAETSESAEEALETLREKQVALAIVDIILPGADGMELIGAIRDLHPQLPLLVITGKRDRNLCLEAFHRGASAFLYKPLDLPSLEATIRRCLQHSSLLQGQSAPLELQALMELQHAIASRLPTERLVHLVTEHMIRVSGADSSSIMLLDHAQKRLRLAAAYGLEGVPEGVSATLDEGVAGWVVKFNQPQIIVGRPSEDLRLHVHERKQPATIGLCLPLRGLRRIMGVLCATRHHSSEPFPPGTVDFGLLLGSELARALEAIEEQERREEAEREMMRRDKLVTIGEMIAGVAHEINNPLGFVSSNLSTLMDYCNELNPLFEKLCQEKGPLDPKELSAMVKNIGLKEIVADLPECIRETQEGLRRVLKIVADLKAMARGDTDVKEPANINEIIEGAIGILWNQIKYKAELFRHLEPLPAYPCYPGQIGQVFMNILHNAVQAISQRGHIWVRSRLCQNSIVVEIEDDGIGMSEDTKKRIFEPFFTTKPRGQGTGLGLKIANKIIKRHRGSIELESAPGRGTLFRIFLPMPAEGAPSESSAGSSHSVQQ